MPRTWVWVMLGLAGPAAAAAQAGAADPWQGQARASLQRMVREKPQAWSGTIRLERRSNAERPKANPATAYKVSGVVTLTVVLAKDDRGSWSSEAAGGSVQATGTGSWLMRQTSGDEEVTTSARGSEVEADPVLLDGGEESPLRFNLMVSATVAMRGSANITSKSGSGGSGPVDMPMSIMGTINHIPWPTTGAPLLQGADTTYVPMPHGTDTTIVRWSLAPTRNPECPLVILERDEAARIREAWRALTERAVREDWDTKRFQEEVAKRVFGGPEPIASFPPALGGAESGAVSPMHTDPVSCQVKQNWSAETYAKHGLPRIVYEADAAHEAVHAANCRASGGTYNAKMSFAKNLGPEEVAAYDRKIAVLDEWLAKNCR